MITRPAPTRPVNPATAYPAVGNSYPAPADAYPAPFVTPTPIPAALPYHNCAHTPGIISCAPPVPKLGGQVAFYDVDKDQLVGIDLKTGQGWAVTLQQPRALEWSSDGSQLLVRMNFPKTQSDRYEYLVFGKDGKLIEQMVQENYVNWQPQGAVLHSQDQPKIVRSPDGAEAWLERTADGNILHFRSSATAAWNTGAINPPPREYLLNLYGWLPGTPNVILTQPSGHGTFSYVMTGLYFYLFNTQTGELSFLKGFNGYDSPQYADLQRSKMVIIQMYQSIFDDMLAILDGKSGDISYPLPRVKGEVQPYSLLQMAWQPGQDGKEGLFALMVRMTRTNIPVPPPVPQFPKDGVYLYNRVTGESQMVRELPENTVGGNFHWTADGKYLLYSLGLDKTTPDAPGSLYARQIDTGREWLLIDHLYGPEIYPGDRLGWNLIAVHMEQK